MDYEKRKKIEQDRIIENMVRQAMKIDSEIICQLWKIFDYDTSRDVYRVYELFLQIYNRRDALDAAIVYGLRYVE